MVLSEKSTRRPSKSRIPSPERDSPAGRPANRPKKRPIPDAAGPIQVNHCHTDGSVLIGLGADIGRQFDARLKAKTTAHLRDLAEQSPRAAFAVAPALAAPVKTRIARALGFGPRLSGTP